MGMEIERRFLVSQKDWTHLYPNYKATLIYQGYLTEGSDSVSGITARVRTSEQGSFTQGWVTVKAPFKNNRNSIVRHEFEYPIPYLEAKEIIHLCVDKLSKLRYEMGTSVGNGAKWIVDTFTRDNSPLVVAEVEIPSEDTEVEIPYWCCCEVTGMEQYSNAALAHTPFSTWSREALQDHYQMLKSNA